MNPKTNKLKNINKYSNRIAELMQEKKAKDIQIFDVSDITTLTDAFIICTLIRNPNLELYITISRMKCSKKV